MTTQAVSRKLASPILPVDPTAITALIEGQEAEVLAFLGKRPTHTVMMAGLIRDNGVSSPLNRGTFYGYRSPSGELEGVMIVGEIVMFEARSERSLEAFARHAQGYPNAYVIVGEHEKVARFWSYYEGSGQEPRLFCRELLFQLRRPDQASEPVKDLRLANAGDLDHVVRVHARMALDESGTDPLEVDAEGFRERCLRRIEQGRVWVWIDNGRIIFKADVVSDTPDVIYLEGVYTDPSERGKGVGTRCISQLGRDLLSRTKFICLLVRQENRAAHQMYRKSRFRLRGLYDTIFLQKAAGHAV